MVTAATEENALSSENGTTAPAIPAYLLSETRFGIGRDSLVKAVEGLPHDQKRSLEWFWRYCAERNIPRSQLGALLEKKSASGHSGSEFYSADAIYQTLTGRRAAAGANIQPICSAIEKFRRQVEPSPRTEGFIETRLARQIWAYCDRALKLKRIGFVFGDMNTGKTFAAAERALRNPACLYTRMPTRGQLGDYLKECARKMALGARSTVSNLRDRVIDGMPDQLLVDEADQSFWSIRNAWGLSTLDLLREAWDRKKCSIVLFMDHHGRNELLRGENSKRLQRLWRRRLAPLQLPPLPYPEDLLLYAKSVGLSSAPKQEITVSIKYLDEDGEEKRKNYSDTPHDLQNAIVAKDGVGVWHMLLQDAAELAREQGRTISWGAVLKAHALHQAMEQKVADEMGFKTDRKAK